MEFKHILQPTPEGTTWRLIVTGGRDFHDWAFFERMMDIALSKKVTEGVTIEIVHGDCRKWVDGIGEVLTTDQMADRYGKEHDYIVTPIRAHWQRYQKRAGPLRNSWMRDYGHAVIAFWNHTSKGTRSMIELAQKKYLPVHIVPCEY